MPAATVSTQRRWLSIEDAAEEGRVSISLVRKWLRNGLPSVKPGGSRRRLIAAEDLERWIQNQGKGGQE